MNFQRLLNTKLGQFFISILLGLGLATLFKRACTEKNCIVFNGPTLKEFDDKIYKHEGKCYKYNSNSAKCNGETKQILDITTEDKIEGAPPTSTGLSFLGSNE